MNSPLTFIGWLILLVLCWPLALLALLLWPLVWLLSMASVAIGPEAPVAGLRRPFMANFANLECRP